MKVWVLLLGIAEIVLCSLFCFTVGIVQCVYQFTSAVITVIFQAIERCLVVSLQSFFLSFRLTTARNECPSENFESLQGNIFH